LLQWVVSSGCIDDDCKRLPKYKPTPALKNTEQRFHLQYLTAAVSGAIAYETTRFGQFEVASQVIGEFILPSLVSIAVNVICTTSSSEPNAKHGTNFR
jgi:hypothetical protein